MQISIKNPWKWSAILLFLSIPVILTIQGGKLREANGIAECWSYRYFALKRQVEDGKYYPIPDNIKNRCAEIGSAEAPNYLEQKP